MTTVTKSAGNEGIPPRVLLKARRDAEVPRLQGFPPTPRLRRKHVLRWMWEDAYEWMEGVSAVWPPGQGRYSGAGGRGCRGLPVRSNHPQAAPVLVPVCMPERGAGRGRAGHGADRTVASHRAVGALAAPALPAMDVPGWVGVDVAD